MTNKHTMSFGSDAGARQSFGLRNAATEADQPPRGANFDTELWQRLLAMSLDDPAAETPVSRRLQIENKWTVAETERAIAEYKRFLYLTQRAGFEVTPSRPVDLVWHEHLMHTKHYWRILCRQVLRNDLHHNPGAGSAVDSDRLSDQYQRTLDAYAAAFGREPPTDIWPRPVAVARRRRGRVASVIAVLAFPVAVFALFSKIWPLLLVSGFAFFAAMMTAANQASAEKRQQERGGCGAGCGGGGIGSTGCADGSSGDGSSSSGDGGGDGGGGGCGGGGGGD